MKARVLILGDPILNQVSREVTDFQSGEFQSACGSLKTALEEFRREKGFGRGMAAIQIGMDRRIIALNLGKETFCMINPEITWRSRETFLLWDDCMSFPDLVVKVKRNRRIDVLYQDELGKKNKWQKIEPDLSELLQHEIDHLDGILATQRAISSRDILYKSEYLKHRDRYDDGIEYFIQSTI